MRNPDRLYLFYEKLRDIHISNFPDLRFGQFCYAVFCWFDNKNIDYFYLEDSEFLSELEACIKTLRHKEN